MIKLQQFITALQEQLDKHGDIQLSISIIPQKEIPKDGFSKYFHMFGTWSAMADTDHGRCEPTFEIHEDKQEGDWLDLVFYTGRIDGEVERMPREEMIREVEKNRKIDVAEN